MTKPTIKNDETEDRAAETNASQWLKPLKRTVPTGPKGRKPIKPSKRLPESKNHEG